MMGFLNEVGQMVELKLQKFPIYGNLLDGFGSV
jgi:hypothetical protein